MLSKCSFRGVILVMFADEERIHLVHCHGIGNAPYKAEIDFLHQQFPNKYVKKEEALRELTEKSTETCWMCSKKTTTLYAAGSIVNKPNYVQGSVHSDKV